jgi:hypothetical protein
VGAVRAPRRATKGGMHGRQSAPIGQLRCDGWGAMQLEHRHCLHTLFDGGSHAATTLANGGGGNGRCGLTPERASGHQKLCAYRHGGWGTMGEEGR